MKGRGLMLDLAHKKLDVWKKSMKFVQDIYLFTESFPKTEIFGITNQLRRASVSVVSNIAEGSSRSSVRERKRFYEISRSSLVEIDTQLEISCKLGYCKNSTLEEFSKTLNHLFAMLTNLSQRT